MRKKELMLHRIEAAKGHVSAAEDDLERLLADMPVAPRSEKVELSRVVEDAFAKLRLAKTGLAELEALAKSDDD